MDEMDMAISMTSAQAIEYLTDFVRYYESLCENPKPEYRLAVVKAVAAIWFAEGVKKSFEERGEPIDLFGQRGHDQAL